MRLASVPVLGLRYWTTISIASVFGANMGDFVSHDLHMGHIRGVPVLAALFFAVLFAEHRARVGNEVYYWLAIVLLRTAATNLGDLTTHDMRLPPQWVMAALAALMIGILWAGRKTGEAREAQSNGVPSTDARYWVVMLLAGTLGTVCGDFVADLIGLPASTAVFVALFMVVLAFGRNAAARVITPYWLFIVLIRTAGTNMGDFLTDGDGLGLGLPISTLASGALLLATALLWKSQVTLPMSERPAL